MAIRLLSALCLSWLLILIHGCGQAPSSHVYKSVPRGHATYRPYTVNGRTYYPLPTAHGFVEVGKASWYGRGFHGRTTASGEVYDMHKMTAAHRILPMNTYVRVTNLSNGREAVVRINDRGPFAKGRIIDLSYAAAKRLGMVGPGVARVRVEALGEGRADASGRPVFTFYPDFEHGRFFIQVGAFTNRNNAERLRRKLARRFGDVVIFRQVVRGRLFYRVQIFAAATYTAAKAFKARLEHAGFPGAFVIAR